MTMILLAALILLDLGLIVVVARLSQRQGNSQLELAEERQLLGELRSSVKEELEAAQAKARATLDKAMRLATEAEQEVKTGGLTLAHEMEQVAAQLSGQFEEPLRELGKRQTYLEALLRRIDGEKVSLQKLLARGEKICRFFDNRVPYEEVLAEIEDKKYADARSLLARGKAPAQIASELGMSETEVRLVAGLTPRTPASLG
ncbi:MAG: hypothetical protein NTZ90_04050 [Proteobacteria bacterium]|nr:hypothetical protein [Pseudomonadota bacterium]